MLKKKLFLTLSAVFLIIFIFLLSFHLFLYNKYFYDWQYEKNDVYETFGYENTWNATHELWSYMKSNGEFYSDFFSEQDKLHMVDVKWLLNGIKYMFILSLVLVLLSFYYHKRNIASLLCYSSILSFIFILIFAILSLFFENSFIVFHKLFFNNDLWLMNPAVDKLVLLYPDNFFFTIFVFIIVTTLIFSFILFVISVYFKKKHI